MHDLVQALQKAKQIVFLTGAGVSTHSGIPDYRSKTGLYANQADPEYLLSHEHLETDPKGFYDFVQAKMYFPEAKPNVIHEEIAELCRKKGVLVTQNVDGLDKKAGNPHVIEFHGNLYQIYCEKCGQQFTYEEYTKSYLHEKDGGLIRPKIVLYGETIDPTVLQQSLEAVSAADIIMIVGTSFRVYPFAQLLQYRPQSTPVYVVNREPIPASTDLHLIQGDALTVFQDLKKQLEEAD